MRAPLLLFLAGLVCVAPALSPSDASARPKTYLQIAESNDDLARPSGGVTSLSHWGFQDTVLYGGTVWAADSMRWEAVRDSVWSFDSGVGSVFGPTGPNKPAGYHTLMEGWYGIDQTLNPLPWFRRSTTCAIAGSYSLWAGVTQAEAESLCYVGGRGYGNMWDIAVTKTFQYPGVGDVTLSYEYAVDAEPGFDYAYVFIDTSGTGAAPDHELALYDGIRSGSESLLLDFGHHLPNHAGPVTLKLVARSDGGYSDEDGYYPTTCGHSAFDNIRLTGAISDFSDFENGMNGWSLVVPTSGVGDYSNIVDVATLPPPVTFCPCGLRDSVLVFFDQAGGHPLDQDNIAASPWIDLRRNGDEGRPGKLLLCDSYREIPLANYVFEQFRVRYYPYVCPINGRIGISPWKDQNIIVFFPDLSPGCNPANTPRVRDYSSVFGANTEQAQLGFGMLSLCRTAPFGTPCTGLTNTTPWFDHIALGVYGGNGTAPNVQTTTFDRFQDNFASDGSLNPAAPGRFDVNRIKNSSVPSPGAILGDTLIARGDGGNTEVRLVFRVRPGPFISPFGYGLRAARWTQEPSIGPNWFSARMDTAEQGGNKSAGIWMSTFHESDPGFDTSDRLPDPSNPSQLANEIIPDNLFTPGTHVDYFVAARYIPPDPRNPGGANWYCDPDTSGGRYREVEILPSSMAADSTWNCVLYVDHHDDREKYHQMVEEAALTSALGIGGANFEGTRYDRFDNQTPSSAQLSFGRWVGGRDGASVTQALGYRYIAWHAGSLSSGSLTDQDAWILRPWLTMAAVAGNRLWATGDGLATSMNITGAGTPARAFLNEVLGATRSCNTIRDINCPSGTPLDSTYCIPVDGVGGAPFASSLPLGARGNGCPDLRSFDLLAVSGSVATAAGQLTYTKSGSARPYASVVNAVDDGSRNYRTVLDGFGLGSARNQAVNPSSEVACRNTAAALARAGDVLGWFGVGSGLCRMPTNLSDVPPPESAPVWRARLGPIAPNPATGPVNITFTAPTGAPSVTLSLFDVTGRVVRRLISGPMPPGPSSITWDARDDRGGPVVPGLYFIRYEAGRAVDSRKLIVVR